MTILWINLALVFIFSILSRLFAKPAYLDNGINTNYPKPNKLLVFLVMATLVIVSGLQTNIGDTPLYAHSFKTQEFNWEKVKEGKDIGFGIYQMILQNFTDKPQYLIFITAMVTNILIIAVFYNYSKFFELSTFVYITGGTHVVSMNGLRQVMAAAICFIAIKYLLKGNFVKYALIILFASTFHFSALILLPMYFLTRVKAWSKFTIFSLVVSILIVIGFEQFTSILFSAIEDTQYSEYSSFDEGGANIIRVVVSSAPLILAYLGRDKLREVFPNVDYIVNMSLFGLIFMIISTQNWIFARVSIYFNLFQLVLISWILVIFARKDQKFIYYCMLIFYFAYYYYETVISLNLYYRSPILENLI
ncbi:EpsG family protein [Bacillus sp. AGMB 02131]|uniref:EpsG family protein n=1 Tax=Peribacillus faecalis TaxID=2772559 RepID=A0A927HAQ5_9BACI|nr:EpsG family protein [Peribacillus faecalis]MBD3107691.1 EpsG family protein [Peribacillus faecalis]